MSEIAMPLKAGTEQHPTIRDRIEDFLYNEAALLDQWKLSDWEALFTADGRYEIAPLSLLNGETLDPETVLFLVADDRARLKQRTMRLMKKSAHAEYPHSRTRHLVSNIRFFEEEGEWLVHSVFVVYRVRRTEVMTYMGQYIHRLREDEGALQIASKRVCLDLESLKPQGTVSIIL